MKRLLYITNGINGAAGLERVLSVKASYLADHLNYDIHIAVLNDGTGNPFYSFSNKIRFHSVRVNENPLKYVISYWKGMRRLVGDVQPDIISVCDDGLKGFFLPLILCKPCPMIYERHVSKIIALGPSPRLSSRIWFSLQNGLMHFLGKMFDRFILLTEDNRKEWKLPNLLVVPNPLPFYPDHGAKLDSKIVIAVGKQGFQKGYDRLLESWKIVAREFPDWQLHIYGKVDSTQRLPELAADFGVSETVFFFEPVPNIEEKFLEASVFAFSSRFEGFGMVLIEAMACGVPCVSYDCPCGPSEIISNGVDGFLVPNGDVEEFATKLRNVMNDRVLRMEFGKKAREHSQKYFSARIVDVWDQLFKSLTRA